MREFGNSFWRWLVVLFVLAFIFVRYMEEAGYFGKAGIWDSLYCAAAIAVPFAAILALFGESLLLSNWWHLRR